MRRALLWLTTPIRRAWDRADERIASALNPWTDDE